MATAAALQPGMCLVHVLRWPTGLALWACLGLAHAGVVTDDQGVAVAFERPPQRVVSLLPALTETVCALGACERLVGVDRYSDHPQRARQLPKVGGGLDPSIEAIVALQPDLVLLASSTRAGQRLRGLGLKVLAMEPKTHADVREVMLRLGAALGVADAASRWQAIDAEVAAAAQSLPAAVRQTRVYFEVNAGPFAASESSFIGETLTRLGVKNIVPGRLGPFPKLNPEFVVRADPDLIMTGQTHAVALKQRPGWSGLRAVRQGRICLFDSEQSNILVRPGPRLAQAARLMAQCLGGGLPQGGSGVASGISDSNGTGSVDLMDAPGARP